MSFFFNPYSSPYTPLYDFVDDIADAVDQVHQAIGQTSNKRGNRKSLKPDDKKAVAKAQSKALRQRRVTRKSRIHYFPSTTIPFFGSAFDEDTFIPALDVHENEKSYTLKVSVPGAAKDHLDINFDKDSHLLSIKGEIPETKNEEKEGDTVVHSEIQYGKFERSLTLPQNVDGENIKAGFQDGILTLQVPKVKNSQNVKKISID
ncbi:DEBR0S4_04654g1_1 [Brettanomyces bruxellensis]|uniref:DEBR0S4_04654g1_1 n=1 Tax=Dekkera bruxellensis TaxID=5007 RepID=A0A7D9CYE8_DEKBR|nr:DEBR0S4_04654g1_1 [Brettanomyces bruxellensis]